MQPVKTKNGVEKPRLDKELTSIPSPNLCKPIGLLNSNNVCFFNSIVQALNSLSSFRNHFINIEGENIFKSIFFKMQSRKLPFSLKEYLVGLQLTDFNLGQQYDAHECLIQMLDKLYPINVCSNSLMNL